MSKKIVIAGSGFAGLWSALSAARAVDLAGKEGEVEVIVVSPSPTLVVRPRLYEAVLDGLDPDLTALFAATGVRHMAGRVETIHADRHELAVISNEGERSTLHYDKFILAAGSTLFQSSCSALPCTIVALCLSGMRAK